MKIRLPKTRRFRVYIYVACTLLVLLAIDLTWVRIWRHISISPQTTYITAPLKPDGMPDYIQYIDDRAREGVTAENNAFIPFLEAITPLGGTSETGQPVILTEYYTRLSLKVPTEPRNVTYFEEYLRAKIPPAEYTEERTKEADLVLTHPWSAAEHPDAMAWLGGNEKMLRLVPAIVARPRWYAPVLSSKSDLMVHVPLPRMGQVRALCHMVITRAMWEIHEKRFAEAQADILACQKMARLMAQGWSLVEYFAAAAIDHMALRAYATLAASPDLPAAQLRQFIAEWDALAPWPTMEKQIDFVRFVTLDLMIYASKQYGKTTMMEVLGETPNEDDAVPPVLKALYWRLRPAHFNAALRDANAFMDQYVEAVRAPTAWQREDRAAAVEAALDAYGKRYQGRMADPARWIASHCVPSFGKSFVLCDVREMTAELTRLALALAEYRADSGAYPETLAVLAPRYLAMVPEDIFSQQPLRYRKTEAGYMLYSVGVDRKDDGGKPPEKGNISHNDLVIQVPQ